MLRDTRKSGRSNTRILNISKEDTYVVSNSISYQ